MAGLVRLGYAPHMVDLAGAMPRQLQAATRSMKLGADVPVMLAHPDWRSGIAVPLVVWMHGRTAQKETDPGRYLRWIRAGIGACAIDLPGHGQRYEAALQEPDRAWDVLRQMLAELDPIIDDLRSFSEFDLGRLAIGGMSLGGMVALARLARPHTFACASVEATTGSWDEQQDRPMFARAAPEDVHALEPIRHLNAWRQIPLQAFHARHDEWVRIEGQRRFIDALRARYTDPDQIDFIVFEQTGAPYEHVGFGREAANAKNRQRDFLVSHLAPGAVV